MNSTRRALGPGSRWRARTQRVAGVLFALSFAECTSNPRTEDAGVDVASEASVAVGVGRLRVVASRGGRLRSEDGLFELYVPAGAIAQDTEFSVTKLDGAAIPAAVAEQSPASGVYSVEPEGLRFVGGGAFARFTIPTVPDGAISNDSPPTYQSMFAFTRAASGGPVEPEVESITMFQQGSRRANVLTRLTHLSIKFAGGPFAGVHLAANLPVYTIDLGPRARYATRVGHRNHALWTKLDPSSQQVGVFIAIDSPLLAERFGTTESTESYGAFGVGLRLEQWWDTPLGADQSGLAMPPPTIYCTGSGVGNEFTVATRGLFRYLGESSEIIHRASAVSVTGQLNCVPGAPPLDSGLPDVAVIGDDTGTRTDASIDANFDGGTPDATGSDALTDIGRDANPCPGPAETRCGALCVQLGSNVDHCGACGRACPALPYANRSCEMGDCRLRCVMHFADCDGDLVNGCETDLRRRGNCGGCGLSPMEVCNGVDDNCDTRIDEGCPLSISAGSAAVPGRLIGSGTGSSRDSPVCPPPRVATGIYGQERDGSITTIGFLCGTMSVEPDRSVTPFRYNIVATGYMPFGTVGAESAFGTPYSYNCPPNMVLTRIEGSADTALHSIRASCSAFTISGSPGAWSFGEMAGASSRDFGMPSGPTFVEDPPPSTTMGRFGGIFTSLEGAHGMPAFTIGNIQFNHKYPTLEVN